MKLQSIGKIARKSGVPASTIRYYEEIELLPPPRRVSGQRRYDDTVLQQLNLIRLAQQAGFTLAEIETLLHDFPTGTPPSARWQVMARQKLEELEQRLQTIHAMMGVLEQTLGCQCDTLEACGAGAMVEGAAGTSLNC
jgi:MerR family redox-sensitive transcriptional activator SoxR